MNLVSRLIAEVGRNPKRIVVVGDIMIDHWVHGHIEECQEGCPKFVKRSCVTVLGGAGNARQCLGNWGVIAELEGTNGIDRPNKYRFIGADGRILYRYDDEHRTDPMKHGTTYCLALEKIELAHGVLISDYDKGFLTPQFINVVTARCRERSIPCVADAKRRPSLYSWAIIKGNIDWCQANGPCDVVTRGHEPPLVGGVSRGQSPPVKCINHVGAGDCFAAHLTLALAYGFSLEDAATIAHSAGRVYVQHQHNRAPHPSEIEDDFEKVYVNQHYQKTANGPLTRPVAIAPYSG